MGRVPVPCLDCGEDTIHPQRGRCTACQRQRERVRNADPKRRGYLDPVYLSQPRFGSCWVPGCTTPADTRDHIVPLADDPTSTATRPACRHHNSGRR